jgi:osmotically-inducible protein OsmY
VAFSGGSELRRLTNELQVVRVIDTSSLEQDARLATAVESLLADNLPEPAKLLKVVVENGRVYLIGRISREQGETVIGLVGRLKGVDDITTVFEYTD